MVGEPARAPLRCRVIEDGDLPAVVALLEEGFPGRGRDYWRRALEILASRDAPVGYPRYGLLLEGEAGCAGVLLQIFAAVVGERASEGGQGRVRCNVSSWYVRSPFRAYASLLVSRALRYREVTYLNVSPAPHTWPILTAQGYRRYSEGQMAAVAGLSLRGLGARVWRYRGDEGFSNDVHALLDAHQALGLEVAVAERGAHRAAFAFLPRRVVGLRAGVAQLVWCASSEDFARFAGPLGRWLARRGLPVTLWDAHGPERGFVGRFFKDRAPKYFRGVVAPRLNDLAWTEAVLFGA